MVTAWLDFTFGAVLHFDWFCHFSISLCSFHLLISRLDPSCVEGWCVRAKRNWLRRYLNCHHVQCTLFVQQHPPFFKVPTSDLICLTSKELTFKRYKQFVSEPTVDADTDCLWNVAWVNCFRTSSQLRASPLATTLVDILKKKNTRKECLRLGCYHSYCLKCFMFQRPSLR